MRGDGDAQRRRGGLRGEAARQHGRQDGGEPEQGALEAREGRDDDGGGEHVGQQHRRRRDEVALVPGQHGEEHVRRHLDRADEAEQFAEAEPAVGQRRARAADGQREDQHVGRGGQVAAAGGVRQDGEQARGHTDRAAAHDARGASGGGRCHDSAA
ncbi:hypothetical protein K7G98_12605 [Saccharothrix sp. MB29]|nr:hypothetical protein [Saccharothrix sp. MB29]